MLIAATPSAMRITPSRLPLGAAGFAEVRVRSSAVTAKPKNPSGFSGVITDTGPKRNGPNNIRAATTAAIPAATIVSPARIDFKVL